MQDDIKIHCTDNDQLVEARIVNHTDGWLTVALQPGNIKLDMKKTKPGLYVGNKSGYEFTYKTWCLL